MTHRIGLVLGDPCGIGPEIVAKLLSKKNIMEKASIVVIGNRHVFEMGEKIAGTHHRIKVIQNPMALPLETTSPILLETPPIAPDTIATGKVSVESGKWQLQSLSLALSLCQKKQLDGFSFAPLNKKAMQMAGLRHEDELSFFAEKLKVKGPIGLMNTLGPLWTSRVTSHVPFKKISEMITPSSVLNAILLADTTLRTAGFAFPRIAVAGLNPHAGDGEMFGSEEKKIITPAILKAVEKGINAKGPFPADTIFLKGKKGVYDAIVTMYHDQGQIAMKLLGFDKGVTVHAGLPFPITTSAHGSAFDIAGKGVASPDAMIAAFRLVCSMVSERR